MTDTQGNRRIVVLLLVLCLVAGMGLLIVVCGVGFWLTARQQAGAAAEREPIALVAVVTKFSPWRPALANGLVAVRK